VQRVGPAHQHTAVALAAGVVGSGNRSLCCRYCARPRLSLRKRCQMPV